MKHFLGHSLVWMGILFSVQSWAAKPSVFIKSEFLDGTLTPSSVNLYISSDLADLFTTASAIENADYEIHLSDTPPDPIRGTTYKIEITQLKVGGVPTLSLPSRQRDNPVPIVGGGLPKSATNSPLVQPAPPLVDGNNYGGSFLAPASLGANDRTTLLTKHIRTIFETWSDGNTNSQPATVAKDDHWYVDINGSGSYYSKGQDYRSINARLSNDTEASYDHFKVYIYNYGNFNHLEQKNSSTGNMDKQEAISAGNTSLIALKIKKHWSAATWIANDHDPAGSNLKLKTTAGVGAEWLMLRYRDSNHPTNLSAQAGVAITNNEYAVMTMFNKLHELYASANVKLIFNWYSKNSKINIRLSAYADMPFQNIKFGMYQGSGSMNYMVNQYLKINASFGVTYRPQSITDPNPNLPVAPLQSNFYNSFTGFTNSFSVGIAVIPKYSTKKMKDMTWTGM